MELSHSTSDIPNKNPDTQDTFLNLTLTPLHLLDKEGSVTKRLLTREIEQASYKRRAQRPVVRPMTKNVTTYNESISLF